LATLSVDTWKVLVFTLARLKSAVLGIVGRIEGTANAIIDVLTVVCGIRFAWVACFETKSISTHKAEEYFSWMVLTDEKDNILVPRHDLSPLAIERLRVNKTTHRVTT